MLAFLPHLLFLCIPPPSTAVALPFPPPLLRSAPPAITSRLRLARNELCDWLDDDPFNRNKSGLSGCALYDRTHPISLLLRPAATTEAATGHVIRSLRTLYCSLLL